MDPAHLKLGDAQRLATAPAEGLLKEEAFVSMQSKTENQNSRSSFSNLLDYKNCPGPI